MARAMTGWSSVSRCKLVPLGLVLGVWQLASTTGLLPKTVLPSLGDVMLALSDLVRSGEIIPHTAASLARAGAGWLVAVVAGIAMGILMARVRAFRPAVRSHLVLTYP